MTRWRRIAVGAATLLLAGAVWAEERFPPPDFESGYKLPHAQYPLPRGLVFEYLDVVVLLLTLAAATYLVYRKRSRRSIFLLAIFSVAYFGFYREGCICPIGSIQNVSLALARSGYHVPLTALAFFLLPLVFALFFGRTYCSAVCPHGALQELVLLRPVEVPQWLEQSLNVLAYAYLGAAVLLSATGSAFIICQYDPFIAFFRRTGGWDMFLLGGSLLLIGVFVGRPYCRYLCPYGVLLGLLSRVSQRRVTIYPDRCVNCRLCEDSCPYGAIRESTPETETVDRIGGRRRLGYLLAALPVLVIACGWLGSQMGTPLSRADEKVRLAQRIWEEDSGEVQGQTDASAAFRNTGQSRKQLFREARQIRAELVRGGWIWGAWIGLVIALKLIALSVARRRTEYEADRAACVACARCFPYCPEEYVRLEALEKLKGVPPPAGQTVHE